MYVIDWYDTNACHHNNVEGHDRTNGRIYKVSYGDAEAQVRSISKKLSDLELAELVLDKNDWYVRHVAPILQERAAAGKLDEAARNRLADIADDASGCHAPAAGDVGAARHRRIARRAR